KKKKKKQKNWGRFRSRLYLLALIAGIFFYFYDYQNWFALKGYKIVADSSKIEQRIWEIFPRRCISFWPYLLSDAKGLKEFLESDMPVQVETHMESWGRFVTRAQWLHVWIKVNWRGNIWSISRDGRMWLYDQGVKNDDEVIGPIWRIFENNENENKVPFSGVFKTPLPVATIENFLREFQTFNWFERASEITLESRAGMNLFILKITNGKQKIEIQVQPDKYPDQDVGQTLEDIFEKLLKENGNHIIDATYEGKILLRAL
ncbi:MAG: hypothetical protein IJ597_00620, partial [Synergistaceae bacterium]|nr:hypothetical protein [Synergistaceae bacterium]